MNTGGGRRAAGVRATIPGVLTLTLGVAYSGRFKPKKMHHTSTRSAAADESAKKKKSGVWNNDTYRNARWSLSFTGELCVSDGQSNEWRAREGEVVGSHVQGRATAASAASTEGGENSPSERTLFFASAGTAGGELPERQDVVLRRHARVLGAEPERRAVLDEV